MASVPPLHLVLDWDGTMTRQDTLQLLGKVCADGQAATATAWDTVVQAYTADFAAHASSYQPTPSQRTTVADEKAWLASLAAVEARSVHRVEKAGIFAGVTVEALRAGAVRAVDTRELSLRPGWSALLAHSRRTTVLSVNWSACFIRECLRAAAADPALTTALDERVSVTANEIAGLGDPNGSPGRLDGREKEQASVSIRTSADKLACLPNPFRRGGRELVVYVGDSTTDLEALLAADVGICIRDEDDANGGQCDLAETLARVGVEQRRIKMLAEMPPADDRAAVVYLAKGLQEVAMSLSTYGEG